MPLGIGNSFVFRRKAAASGPDVTAPSLQLASVSDAIRNRITLSYNESLDTGSIPATGDFSVSGGKTVSGVAVSGATVTITVNSNYAFGDVITVSYTKGSNPIQDTAGNDAANLSSQAVTNNIAGDTTAPTLSTATVETGAKNQIVLTYNEALDTGSVPATGDFSLGIAATSPAISVSSVGVSGSAVTLTLNRNINPGDTSITVSYTQGTNKIRDLAANNAANLTNQAVTNNTTGIGFRVLTIYTSDSDAVSYTTSSYTPAANALVLAFVLNTRAANPSAMISTSGNGLTWVTPTTHNTTFSTIATATKRIYVRHAMGSSPTTEGLTVSFTPNTQTGIAIAVVEFTGVDTGGTNGSAAFVQSVTNRADSGADPGITLAALGSANNAAIAAIGSNANPFSGTPESNWIEVSDTGFSTPTTGFYLVFRIGGSDNTVAVTASAANWGGIAVEVKAA